MCCPQEFFAEMSVTYLSDNYHELDEEDKTCMARCNPPCLEPTVLERIQQQKLAMTLPEARVKEIGILQRQLTSSNRSETKRKDTSCPLQFLCFLMQCCKPKEERMPRILVPHCNKFYPFTRGQLKYHDISTYRTISELWREIELWDDPFDDRLCGKGFLPCLPFLKQSNFQSDLG